VRTWGGFPDALRWDNRKVAKGYCVDRGCPNAATRNASRHDQRVHPSAIKKGNIGVPKNAEDPLLIQTGLPD